MQKLDALLTALLVSAILVAFILANHLDTARNDALFQHDCRAVGGTPVVIRYEDVCWPGGTR